MREPKHLTDIEMRTLLRDAYSHDPEKSLMGQMARAICDPAKPRDPREHARLHPLWRALGLIAGFIVAVAVYFSCIRS